MPSPELSVDELCVLLLLLAEAREIDNHELDETYGLRLTGKTKARLNERQLVASRKVKGSLLAHRLTPEGRAACDDAMSRPLAHGGGPKVAALSAILLGLARRLREENKRSLTEFFHAGESRRSGGETSQSATANIEKSLRVAYRQAAQRDGDWVSLDTIRAALGNVPKSELDEALIKLARANRVHLAPNDYQSRLTPAQRRAGINIGGRENHLIMIEG